MALSQDQINIVRCVLDLSEDEVVTPALREAAMQRVIMTQLELRRQQLPPPPPPPPGEFTWAPVFEGQQKHDNPSTTGLNDNKSGRRNQDNGCRSFGDTSQRTERTNRYTETDYREPDYAARDPLPGSHIPAWNPFCSGQQKQTEHSTASRQDNNNTRKRVEDSAPFRMHCKQRVEPGTEQSTN
jgi:hypothetical protein